MCVIAAKPAGVSMPQWETIKQMWDSNKDGAGLMWLNKHNKVEISKGYMKYEDFERQVKSMGDLTDVPVVMHFRITTHGGTSPENTHPFPVSDNVEHLKALDVTCNLAMAHNGTINTMPREDNNSDTQIYIRDILTPLSVIAPDNVLEDYKTLIDKTISSSRLAFLDTSGTITLFGTWSDYDKAPGVKFSNLVFKPYVPRATTYIDYTSYGKSYSYSRFETGEYYVIDPKYKNAYILKDFNMNVGDLFYVYDHQNKQYMMNWDTMEEVETSKVFSHYFKQASKETIDSKMVCTPNGEKPKNNIGGKNNEETAQVTMNADRDKLYNTFEERLLLKRVSKGAILEGYDEITDTFYEIHVKSTNWFYNEMYDEIIYMQKDGTLIVVPEVTIPLYLNDGHKILDVDYEILDTLVYYDDQAYWRKGLI